MLKKLKYRRLEKEKHEKNMRTVKERGITLIALIVTIVLNASAWS